MRAARTISPGSLASSEYREIETCALLEPKRAARETFDDDALNELIKSIGDVGLIEPLIVAQEDENFRILAGHRRFIACRALDFKSIPCLVRMSGDISGAAVTVHENAYREDLNAAEQARYYGELLEAECGADVDRLCALLHQTRAYVETRLLLLRGDPKVLEALSASAISLGVAAELNKVSNRGNRLVFLDAAMQGGASIRTVRNWRVESAQLEPVDPAAISLDYGQAGPRLTEPAFSLRCFLCEDDSDPHTMQLLYAHSACKRLLLDHYLKQLRGGGIDDQRPTA